MRSSIAAAQMKISRTLAWITSYALVGTIVPLIFHSYGLAGPRFLPIFLFTLIGAVTISPSAALAVAMIIPLANNLITGMPTGPMLLLVLIKGSLIVGLVKLLSSLFSKNKVIFSVSLVLSYQIIGLLIEGMFINSFSMAWQHFVFSWPGILIQILVLNIIFKYQK